jgi:CRP/FNR family cyclic AMP-dependent transcriptional regulator
MKYVPLTIAHRTVLTKDELATIAPHAPAREYAANTVVVAQADTGCALYVIVEGRCKAYVSHDGGRETVLSEMGPGEYFGEISLDEGPRSASVMTLEPSKLLVVEPGEFQAFLALSPEFAFHLIGKLIHRIRELTKSVGNLAQMDVYGRVARLLIESAVTEGEQMVVPAGLEQADIASRVGSPPELVGHIVEDLVRGGYIALEGERMVILRKPPARW